MNTDLIAARIVRNYKPTQAHVIDEILCGLNKKQKVEITAKVVVGWINLNKEKRNEGN